MSPGAGWLILMNGRPESGSMSRAIFSLLTFQGSSASCLFILHDLISVAGDDESTMNPGLRFCIELPRRGILRSSQGKQNHMIARCVQYVRSMCGVERIPNQRRSDDFEVQTIIGHGGPDDARSSGGARPPSDRCSKAPRYAPGEFDDRGAGTGRP